MDNLTIIIVLATFALVGGFVGGKLSRTLKFPRTILLLLVGIIVASVNSLFIGFYPPALVQDLVATIANITLVLVLFREGLTLNLRMVKRWFLEILLLATIGIVLATVVTAVIGSIFLERFGLVVLLLLGAAFSTTDPSATLAIFDDDTPLNKDVRSLLIGESSFNDIVSIILVLYIFLPMATQSSNLLRINLETVVQFLFPLVSAILIGVIVAFVYNTTLLRTKLTDNERIILTLSEALSCYALSLFIPGSSSAIAALVAGMLTTNPKFLPLAPSSKTAMLKFWEETSVIFETIAFVFVGFLFNAELVRSLDITSLGLAMVVLSVAIFLARFVGVFISFGLAQLLGSARKVSLEQRLFISSAGLKGLPTVVLVTVAASQLRIWDPVIASSLLVEVIIILLVLTSIQGVVVRRLVDSEGVGVRHDPVEELQLAKLQLVDSQNFLLALRELGTISQAVFKELTLPVKEELLEIEQRVEELITDRQLKADLLDTQRMVLEHNLDTIMSARDHYSRELVEGRIEELQTTIEGLKKELEVLNSQKRYSEKQLQGQVHLTALLVHICSLVDQIEVTEELENEITGTAKQMKELLEQELAKRSIHLK